MDLHVLGLMSGSSLDGLDLAYCHFKLDPRQAKKPLLQWSIGQATTLPYTADWRQRLADAPNLSGKDLWQLHTAYGKLIGELVQQHLAQHDIHPDLIGSHGHTVFHFPAQGFTTQIGDGAAIAVASGLPTITEFRATDIARGGQGAPLAPLADRYCFGEYDFCLNLGGIINVSARTPKGYVAYDLTFANQILDLLAQREGLPYDAAGALARSGKLQPRLLVQLNELPYLRLPYPKSLDNGWVREQAWPVVRDFDAPTVDLLRTACEHIAQELAEQLGKIIHRTSMRQDSYRMLVTGGGAYNTFLLECIRNACRDRHRIELVIPAASLIEGKEAMFIGLAAALRYLGLPNCLSEITGATRDSCNGALYLP